MQDDELLDQLRQELRRGSVVLASLVALQRPGYGYGLLDSLERAGFPVAGNTLYPLLRRLESQGLLTSEWDTTEARPRKFYRTSEAGIRMATQLRAEWGAIDAAMSALTAAPAPPAAAPVDLQPEDLQPTDSQPTDLHTNGDPS